MTLTLKTKLIRIFETDEPIHGAMGHVLTGKRFFLKNGIWIQAHVYNPITLAGGWELPEPGEFVRRGNPEVEVGCS